MADDLDNPEFWLPSEFLADGDIFAGRNTCTRTEGVKCLYGENSGGSGLYRFPSFASFGLNSDLSSPVESVVGSTETESDEEEYIAELARRMARSTVNEDLWKADSSFGYDTKKARMMSSSPQSTLCGGVSGCGCKHGSSRGSPNCLSPPSVAAGAKPNAAAWDLLYAAAGEIARMRMAEEVAVYNQGRGLLGPPRKPSPISVPLKNPNPNFNPNLNPNFGVHHPQSLSYHQLQAQQFQQLKQQQMMKQQSAVAWGQSKAVGLAQYQQSQTNQMVHNRARNSAVSPGVGPVGLAPCAWPTLQQSQQSPQQQPGSGMRAVFLGNGASKRECAGTGVFLPRRVGTPTETRKKPGCSTVLLPDRVVQALNLNLEAMEAPPNLQPRCNGSFNAEYDAALKYRNNVLMAQQRRGVRPQPAMSNELRLPQEWTY
ncbi:hypothetical protein LguiA_032133 [Lonicera macranthoides]